MFRRAFHRALTPLLSALVIMLGTITGLSVSQSQQKAEAFSCFSACSNLNPCQPVGSCRFCTRNECLVS